MFRGALLHTLVVTSGYLTKYFFFSKHDKCWRSKWIMCLNEHMHSNYFGKQTEVGVKSGLALQLF